ncbi:MAG: hypothetical protein HQK78_17415, partial [Desulfobacterales bacterium]|nr:hypothetical protein [Desulfobacterales bacterium]
MNSINTKLKIIFFICVLIIFISVYRATQIVSPKQDNPKENILIFPDISKDREIARIVFDSDGGDKRGNFKIKELFGALKVKNPKTEQWEEVKIGKPNYILTDGCILNFYGKNFRFNEYPSSKHWVTFCNRSIMDLGIVGRFEPWDVYRNVQNFNPFSISFKPQTKFDRILLPKDEMEKLLKKQITNPEISFDVILAYLKNWIKKIASNPPVEKSKHQAILINFLVEHINNKLKTEPKSLIKEWDKNIVTEQKINLLNQWFVNYINCRKDEISNRLMPNMPIDLQQIFQQKKKITIEETANLEKFKSWIKSCNNENAVIQIKTLKLDDTFEAFDILNILAKEHIPDHILYDKFKNDVLGYLEPELPKEIKEIRKWLWANEESRNISRSFFSEDWILRAITYFSNIDFDALPRNVKENINNYLIQQAIETGRVACFMPSLGYSSFLPTVSQDWRIKAMVPDIIKIEKKNQEAISLKFNEQIVLNNDDIIC